MSETKFHCSTVVLYILTFNLNLIINNNNNKLKNGRRARNCAKLVFDQMAAPAPEIMDMSVMNAATN
jgi:hypothetical protein